MGRSRATRLFNAFAWSAHGMLLLLVLWLDVFLPSSGTAAGQKAATQEPPAAAVIDFRRPARAYKEIRMGELKVAVEKQLQEEDPATATKALERLKAVRTRTLAALPAKARKQLAEIPFFLMYGPEANGGGRDNGLEYFQKDAPEYHPELDRRWGDAIVIYSALNYMRISDLWAQKALVHEFAHAYQLEQWPEHQPDIQTAWEHARDSGLYHNVRDAETGETIENAYALVNQLEYFAELSCMYFARCNYRPTDRGELKSYDPTGYAMIRKLWAAGK